MIHNYQQQKASPSLSSGVTRTRREIPCLVLAAEQSRDRFRILKTAWSDSCDTRGAKPKPDSGFGGRLEEKGVHGKSNRNTKWAPDDSDRVIVSDVRGLSLGSLGSAGSALDLLPQHLHRPDTNADRARAGRQVSAGENGSQLFRPALLTTTSRA